MKNQKYIAKTFQGLEDALALELIKMGATNVTTQRRSVHFEGDKKILYRANYESRLALSILKPLFSFKARNENELYKNIYEYNWKNLFRTTHTFSIVQVVNSKFFTHTKYAALKTKDAIADHFRDEFNRRPSVDTDNPDIKIHLHINDSQVNISIDTSGESLFKRGYRTETNQAPINEIMAAGLVALSGWDKKSTFIDPFCGSGTIAIEAGFLAFNIPAGICRKRFGFEKMKDYDKALFEQVKTEAQEKIVDKDLKISGFDNDPKSLRFANKNLSNIDLLKSKIRFKLDDALEMSAPLGEKGVIVTNPPYGERLHQEDIIELYTKFGRNLRANFDGYKIFIISPNQEALESLSIEPNNTIKLKNGQIDCDFNYYKL